MQVCGKRYPLATNLTRHMWTHTEGGARPAACKICSAFSNYVKAAVEKHVCDEHGVDPGEVARHVEVRQLPKHLADMLL